MSVLVFDHETLGMIRYILATQRFEEYSVGPLGLSEYLCAFSLERVLIQTALKLPKFEKENPKDMRLFDVVRFLDKKNLVSPTVANKLGEYVDFYDSIMRIGSQAIPEKAGSKAQEILDFLCMEAGINQGEELKNRVFAEIATLKTEQPTEEAKCEIAESDFDTFSSLYKKGPCIQQEIEKKLTTPLKSAPISNFSPNTGGIWLPFVTNETSGNRGHIDGASIGVFFTPINIRIGLDFGNRSHSDKIRYYDLLLKGELTGEFDLLNRKGTGYCLCDTFWCYYLRNVQSLQWCLTLYGGTKIAIENAIEETKQLQGAPLTANRYLIGKVINRRPEDFTYIVKGLVNEISNDLNELYPILERIKKT